MKKPDLLLPGDPCPECGDPLQETARVYEADPPATWCWRCMVTALEKQAEEDKRKRS